MQLNKAVSERIFNLCNERSLSQYGLYKISGVPPTTLNSIIKCIHETVTLRVLYEISEGFGMSLIEFFDSPLFERENIDD